MAAPGTMLSGRYRIDERIAGGGMGDVWRGTDDVLGRTVAIKTMRSALLDEPGFVERFRAEARTMATISHAGVVRIYDFGNDQDVAYLIMELVEGEPLSRTLGKVGRLTPARTMALIAQAADALHAAHEKGIVHRDVKPANLLVRPNGTLVLTDFGISRSATAAALTATGAVLGTASYVAPEQAAGSVATAASDIYSLGVVTYQCLTGHRPYEGDTPLEIAMKHLNGTPRPMPADIPPVVRQLVAKAMAREPSARWVSAAQLAEAARRAASAVGRPGSSVGAVAPVSPTPVSPGPPTPTPVPPGPVRPTVMPQPTAQAANRPPIITPQPVPFQRGSAAVPAPTRPAPTRPAPVAPYRPQQPAARYHPRPAPAATGASRAWAIVGIVVLAVLVVVCAGWLGFRWNIETRDAGLQGQNTVSVPAQTGADSRETGNSIEGRRRL